MEISANLFLVIALSIVTLVFWVPRFRLKRALDKPLPADFEEIIKRNLPVYRKFPEHLKAELHQRINQFLYQKKFYGCAGLEITEEIRVTIAAQACLLLLNRRTSVYPEVKSVLVYPSSFAVARAEAGEAGVISHHSQGLLGESWSNGRVILSWDHSLRGAKDFTDGQNVVLHEFAHQLDGESGTTNGAPLLGGESSYARWATVLSKEFEALQKDAIRQRKSVMDHYGASNTAEFFAVATETFFEKPEQMAAQHPELFAEMERYYRTNPQDWAS